VYQTNGMFVTSGKGTTGKGIPNSHVGVLKLNSSNLYAGFATGGIP